MIAIFPELASAAASGEIELLAVLVRKYFGGDRQHEPRILLSAIVKASGIRLVDAPLSYHGALVVKDDMGRIDVSMLIASEVVRPEDKTFLLAHLLGHFLLHCQPLLARGDWPNTGFQESVLPLSRLQQKQEHRPTGSESTSELADYEADRFATALLMPKGMFKRAFDKLGSPEKVAVFFAVPTSAVYARVAMIEEGSNAPVSFLDAEGMLQAERADSHSKNKAPEQPASILSPAPRSGRPNRPTGISEQGVSKSFAAANYHSQSIDKKKNSNKPAPGMDRIRDLARKMDPTV